LIQKKTGFRLPGPAGSSGHILLNQKHTFPPFSLNSAMPKVIGPSRNEKNFRQSVRIGLWVSVLDLEITCLVVDPKIRATWPRLTWQSHMKSDVYLSIRCQFVRLDGETLGSAWRSNRAGVGGA